MLKAALETIRDGASGNPEISKQFVSLRGKVPAVRRSRARNAMARVQRLPALINSTRRDAIPTHPRTHPRTRKRPPARHTRCGRMRSCNERRTV